MIFDVKPDFVLRGPFQHTAFSSVPVKIKDKPFPARFNIITEKLVVCSLTLLDLFAQTQSIIHLKTKLRVDSFISVHI